MLKGSLKVVVAGLGCISVALGVIGIFLPILPTTPFLLLAAWLFAHSSETFHNWLQNHPKLGPIIRVWQSGEGLEIQIKRRILLFMWAGMLLSAIIVAKLWAVIMLASIGTCVSIYIYRLPVKQP